MARTFQQVLDLARRPLNDDDKTRFPDSDLLEYANTAVTILRAKRPDLFFGTYTSLPAGKYTLGSSIPFDDALEQPLADYVTARAEFRNDSASVQERAAAFFNLFNAGVS